MKDRSFYTYSQFYFLVSIIFDFPQSHWWDWLALDFLFLIVFSWGLNFSLTIFEEYQLLFLFALNFCLLLKEKKHFLLTKIHRFCCILSWSIHFETFDLLSMIDSIFSIFFVGFQLEEVCFLILFVKDSYFIEYSSEKWSS